MPNSRAGGDAGHEEDGLEEQHAVAAEAVNLVAELLALGHRVARLGELIDAVDGDGEEEERRTSGVDIVRNLDGNLEESDRSAVGNPADLAGEEDDAESGDAGNGGYQIVRGVVADVGNQHYARGHQHSHNRRGLIVSCGEAPPPVFAGMGRDAGGEDCQNVAPAALEFQHVAGEGGHLGGRNFHHLLAALLEQRDEFAPAGGVPDGVEADDRCGSAHVHHNICVIDGSAAAVRCIEEEVFVSDC